MKDFYRLNMYSFFEANYMTRIVVFSLFVLWGTMLNAITSKGDGNRYPSVFKTCRDISIHDIHSSDSTTTITLRITKEPSTIFCFPKDFRIIDAEGGEFLNICQDSIPDIACVPLSGELLHEVIFFTPKKLRWPIDLISGHNQYRDICIFGVHQSRKSIKSYKSIEKCGSYPHTENGHTLLAGRIVGKCPTDFATLLHKSLGKEYEFGHRFPIARIDKNGEFRFDIMCKDPIWGMFQINKDVYPVYLVPNDTTYVEIDFSPKNDVHTIKYRNKDVQNFMKADYLGPWLGNQLTELPQYPANEIVEKTKLAQDSMINLYNYLSDKYSLHPYFSHLLVNRAKLHVAIARLRVINSQINHFQFNTREHGLKLTDDDLKSFETAYRFLKEIDIEDSCLSSQVEYPMFLSLLNNSFPLKSIISRDSISIASRLNNLFPLQNTDKLNRDLTIEYNGTMGYKPQIGEKVECSALEKIIKQYLNQKLKICICESENDLTKLKNELRLDKAETLLLLFPKDIQHNNIPTDIRTNCEFLIISEDDWWAIREWLHIGTLPCTIEINNKGDLVDN